MGKGENACNQHFLLSANIFYPFKDRFHSLSQNEIVIYKFCHSIWSSIKLCLLKKGSTLPPPIPPSKKEKKKKNFYMSAVQVFLKHWEKEQLLQFSSNLKISYACSFSLEESKFIIWEMFRFC